MPAIGFARANRRLIKRETAVYAAFFLSFGSRRGLERETGACHRGVVTWARNIRLTGETGRLSPPPLQEEYRNSRKITDHPALTVLRDASIEIFLRGLFEPRSSGFGQERYRAETRLLARLSTYPLLAFHVNALRRRYSL